MDFDTTGAFVDNALMVLCARHQPPLEETDELGDPIVGVMRDPQWILVAQSLQALLMHPKTDTERLALRWVDPMHFNPAVCRHRAQYILWRQRKQLEERKQATTKKTAKVEVSDYNVLTSVSLKQEVDQLMADVRSKLPTVTSGAAGDGDSDDIEEDGEEIFRPPQHMLQSDTDVAQAEAEAVLLQHVQEMQLEHYKRYHKWVETSYGTGGTTAGTAGNIAASHTASAGGGFSSSNNGTPSKALPAAGAGGRSGLTSQDDVQDIPLDKCSTQNVADLLEYLGVAEHSHKFRRTTGRLLLQLKKEDMRERFGEDFEAADLLWTYIDENRVAVPSAAVMAAQRRGGGSAAHSQVRKLYEDARAPNSNLSSQSNNLSTFEKNSNPKSRQQQETQMQELLSKGDLSSIKRSMNPNRPARPSARQEVYDCSTSEDDNHAYGHLGENYLRGVHGSTSDEASTPEKNRNNAGVSKSMTAGGGYPNRPTGSSETESTTSSQSGAAAGMVAPRTAGAGNPAAARMGTTSGPRGNDATYVDPAKKTQVNTAAPSRANRWAVVEYSDDDSDDN